MLKGADHAVAWSGNDLAEVAKWQKYIILLVVAEIQASVYLGTRAARLSALSTSLPAYLGLVLCVCFAVFGVYFTYSLARSVRDRAAVLYAILVLVPGINALVLLMLNSTATGILRGNGIRVSLKGANPADLALKQTDLAPPPPVDKLRVVAFALVVAFLLIVAIATMNLLVDVPVEVPDRSGATRSTTDMIGHPADARTTATPPQQMPAPPPTIAPTSPPPSAASTQSASASGRPVLVADTTITIGNKTAVQANSPSTKYAVVFEDSGETGYFYGLDRENTQNPILDSLHIYDVASVKDRANPFRVQIIWSANGMQAAIFIARYPYAVFDFDACRGYCRTGQPAPNQQFTRYSHEWRDDALRFFR